MTTVNLVSYIDGDRHSKNLTADEALNSWSNFGATFFSTVKVVLYLAITFEPVELQKTAAPNFGVAHGARRNGQVRFDLKSP